MTKLQVIYCNCGGKPKPKPKPVQKPVKEEVK